ncbi:OLC1v1026239C1 [Oldenlandia corymbosa var. corymbosa]|uniref:OLC1v1026239C1 n=1 Tax=Oldenlandia corymbosa var. corymbosa TaxID=529605 RepID=A0AAV1C6P0_OLDCO|nr:OLC1v1026239C1 [Oldenlandia corymbosa var. corymbosa]
MAVAKILLTIIFPCALSLCYHHDLLVYAIHSASPAASYFIGNVAINCGSTGKSSAFDGRQWIGDAGSGLMFSLQPKGKPKASTAVHKSFFADPVPYRTSRISAAPFYYKSQVSPGQKFIRLHFLPVPYHGFRDSEDLFTVKAGPLTLLYNFSASLAAEGSGESFLVKEFCLNERGARIVGRHDRFFDIDNSTALELIERLNTGDSSISSVEDFGLFRRWNGDANHFTEHRVHQVIYPAAMTTYTNPYLAPPKVYQTSWKLEPNLRVQGVHTFRWKIPIDIGFGYLVRLHFCASDLRINNVGEKEFSILINDQIAETMIDVIKLSGGIGIPLIRDYMVMMKGDKQGGKFDLLIDLCTTNDLVVGQLNGMEIFKLSNPDNSLAAPNQGKLEPSLSIDPSFCSFSLSKILSATQEFSEASLIGRGGFGKVYKGYITGISQVAAIKRLNANSKQGAREFWAEVETLSKFRHNHIVSLIGYCNEGSEMILVYEPTVDVRNPEDQPSLLSSFRDCSAQVDSEAIIDPSLQGRISASSLKEFVKSIENCLHQQPKKRPTMAQQDKPTLSGTEDGADISQLSEDGRSELMHFSQSSSPPMPEESVTWSPKEEITKEPTEPKKTKMREDSSSAKKPIWGWPWRTVWSRGKPMNKTAQKMSGTPNRTDGRFSFSEILKMTKNFQSFLGQGGSGRVYYGVTEGKQVAVKLLVDSSRQKRHDEFLSKAKLLTRVNHSNLIMLVGYCCEGNHMALIYEYMDNENLRDHILDGNVLTWSQRLQIAMDAAQDRVADHAVITLMPADMSSPVTPWLGVGGSGVYSSGRLLFTPLDRLHKLPRTPGTENGLPEGILTEVLVRVDIKTLHQAKCVSKSWLAIIEGSVFRDAYRAHRLGCLILSIPEPIIDPGQAMKRTQPKFRPPELENGLPDELILEVLARVENIKTLYLAKCVSKSWCSIVEGPGFFDAYQSHHAGGLVLSVAEPIKDPSLSSNRPTLKNPWPVKVNFFSSTLVAEGFHPRPFFRSSSIHLSNCYRGLTTVVNGLVCVFETTRLLVCNIWTGETMQLPDVGYRENRCGFVGSKYYLGYDDDTRVYKLLNLSELYQSIVVPLDQFRSPYFKLDFEILTLGHDSSWRRHPGVAGGPLVNMGSFFTEVPLLIKGVLYWMMSGQLNNCLISFYLNKEEFQLIQAPLNDPSMIWEHIWTFAQIGGRPALYQFRENVDYGRHLFFYLLDDDSWSSHSIPFPPEFVDLDYLTSIGNLPTGQTLFIKENCLNDLLGSSTTIYSYDHQSKEFGKLFVGKICHLKRNSRVAKTYLRRTIVTCLQEGSIAPLDVQLNGG